jgi:hypothetical protein
MVYGNSFGGDVLYNLRVGIYGIQVSFRFIAKDDVPVNKIRYFNTFSFTKPGYHAGTGGKIRIDIQTDDNTDNHAPSGNVIATSLIPNPLQLPSQLLVNFDKTVVLEKGKIYHIVFTNYDDYPETNHISVDMMSIVKKRDQSKPEQPELSDVDMTTLWRDKYNKNWRRFKPDLTVTPIFTLYYGVAGYPDGVSVAGYGGMESWIREPRQISDTKKVRQIFTPYQDTIIKNIGIRVAKNSINIGTLKILVYQENNLICKASINSQEIPLIDTKALSGFRTGHEWVYAKFDSEYVLSTGKPSMVVLEAQGGGSFEVFPIRDGEQFGYASIWPNSWCEYTLDGNKWVGWDAWGNSNLKIADLQLYFNSKNI